MTRLANTAADLLASAPPLPLESDHWRAVVARLELSPQHAKIAELVCRDLSDKEIAVVLGLGEGTVKDYFKRFTRRIGVRGRMQFAMHVLAVSHQVKFDGRSVRKDDIRSDGV